MLLSSLKIKSSYRQIPKTPESPCLPLGKAVGPDCFNIQILQEFSRELLHPLCSLINHFLALESSLKHRKMIWCLYFTKKETFQLFLTIVQFPFCPVRKMSQNVLYLNTVTTYMKQYSHSSTVWLISRRFLNKPTHLSI